MVIFNDKELKSPYSKTENRVIQITTPLTMKDVLTKLMQGEELNPQEIAIASYRYADEEFSFQDSLDDADGNNIYDFVYTSQDEIDNSRHIEYQRPFEFDMFEKYTFGRSVAADFKPEPVALDKTNEKRTDVDAGEESFLPYDTLLTELKAAAGCLPTLLNQELTYDEMRKYANEGAQLIHPGIPISKYNPCPTIQDIDHFVSMNDYERRLITSGFIHPYKAFTYAQALKDTVSAGYVFNTADYNQMFKERPRSVEKFVENRQTPAFEEYPQIEKWIGEAFQEVHKFTPQVAKEYIEGCLTRDIGMRLDRVTKNMITDYVRAFNRTSVSKIARTKSPALLALSPYINFAEVPRQTTEALSVYVNTANIHALVEKGFPDWFNSHKDVNPSELTEMIERHSDIDGFPLDKSAKELLIIAKNKKGYEDSQRFAKDNMYRIDGKPYDFADNEIAISGRHTVAKQGGITMRMLDKDDYANFTVGYDTTCCQHYGSAGESCVAKLTSDPFAAVVVIEEGGKVKAQGFVWTDEQTDTLVFDNVEFAGNDSLDNRLSQKYLNIFHEWCKAMPYKNIHVGTGYNESMRGWGQKVDYFAKLPTTLTDIHTYSDYHEHNARSIKKDGVMQLGRTSNAHIEVTTTPDEPTKWDELKKPEMAFMLNACNKTVEERIAFAKAFYENPTPEIEREILAVNPQVIKNMENPSEAAQNYILEHHKELAKFIKNPCAEVQYFLIGENPAEVLKLENPSEDLITIALSHDGSLLKHFENATYEQCLTAVRNHGMAIKDVPEEHLTEEIQVIAVENTPKALKHIPNPCAGATLAGIGKEPSLISCLVNPSQDTKLIAIRALPALVLDIKNPILPGETVEEHNDKVRQLWTEAVQRNGYLIRNCGRTLPELRPVAIRQTPYAIGCLLDPTHEEIELALNTEPKAALFIKTEEGKAYAEQYIREALGEQHIPRKHTYEMLHRAALETEILID